MIWRWRRPAANTDPLAMTGSTLCGSLDVVWVTPVTPFGLCAGLQQRPDVFASRDEEKSGLVSPLKTALSCQQ